jgi:glucose-6-phosphate dehydrogenase assembly protein OpcA
MTACLPIDPGPVEVPLSAVDRELTRQTELAHGPGSDPVQRARMSNLIIHCASAARAAEVDAMIPALVRVHPARVILVIADDSEPSGDVRASVLVRKAGQQAQLCSEQITLRGGHNASDHLPFAVRGLLIGDLPTNLWWANPTPPALAGPVLDELAEHAQQIIYDSLGWPDPHRGVAATWPWLKRFERGQGDRRWRVASDLNWRRLKIWRRLIAQAFAPAAMPGALDSITEIVIEHGPHAVTQAWQLTGWMASRLGWTIRATKLNPNVEVAIQIAARHGLLRLRIDRLPDGPSELRRVHMACTLHEKLGALDFVADDHARIAVQPEGIDASPRTIAVPPSETADILGRQLSDREPDPVFREAMAAAHILAQAVLR